MQNPEARFELFIEEALKSETAWSLEVAGRLTRFQLPDGRLALPLWPAQEAAALEAADAAEQPKIIDLGELLESILPELAQQNGLIAVFPLKGESFVCEPQQLLDRLLGELDEDD